MSDTRTTRPKSNTSIRCSIEFLFEKERMIIVRAIDSPIPSFSVTKNTTLGGILIHPYLTQPRALTPEGKPRFDLYVFRLKGWSESLHSGQELLLSGLDCVSKDI